MKFGQYELLELIAVGGMAEVFKGRVVAAEGFEKFVAIKRILPDLAEDDRFVSMLLREARIHAALSHRNIVQIHDLGISEDGQYFIVLEFVEGYDLRMIIEQLTADREIVPEALSLYIASELAQGLHFAHEQLGPDGHRLGLVHRDVTPSNVLISFAGEVKLSDFGLAKRTRDRSVVGSVKGNLSYMSPEQAMQAPLDRRTDIFSLGAVMFEMLTGRRLREITNEVAAWSHVASGVIPSARELRPDLPVPIERLLDRALAPDPVYRYPDAAAFGAEIRDVLGDMNVAVGASDVAALLAALTPPRRPRHLMLERSRVIRLGREAQALIEAFAAPTTPAPVATRAPPPPAASTRRSSGRGSSPALNAAVAIAYPPGGHPAATALPDAATPVPSGPIPPRAPRRPTPAAPAGGRNTPTGPTQPLPPHAVPRPSGRSRESVQVPLPSAPNRTLRKSGAWPSAPPAGQNPPTRKSGEWAASRPGSPPPGPPAVRRSGEWPAPAAPPGVLVGTPAGSYPAPGPPRAGRETARVRIRSRRPRGQALLLATLLAVLLLGATAAVVHRYVVPLDVLAAWRDPATLVVGSVPPGAALRLDGIRVPSSAAAVEVKRDFAEHVVDATLPGYLPARARIRFDKSVSLSCVVRLDRDPSAPIKPSSHGEHSGVGRLAHP
jgi:eukaryotic-like serine/threonine-protein kinase